MIDKSMPGQPPDGQVMSLDIQALRWTQCNHETSYGIHENYNNVDYQKRYYKSVESAKTKTMLLHLTGWYADSLCPVFYSLQNRRYSLTGHIIHVIISIISIAKQVTHYHAITAFSVTYLWISQKLRHLWFDRKSALSPNVA